MQTSAYFVLNIPWLNGKNMRLKGLGTDKIADIHQVISHNHEEKGEDQADAETSRDERTVQLYFCG
jgi:hypothetical protein